MKAVIMAGGEGSRLRPLTCDLPKPMARLCGRPVLEYILELLGRHGFREAALTLRYLPERITGHFPGGEFAGVKLRFFEEDEPLGTAGSVKNACCSLGDEEDVLVISGDALCDFDLGAMARLHRESGADVTIAAKRVEDPREYGLLLTGQDGRVTAFLEKPAFSQAVSDLANTGIYILSRAALALIPGGRAYDFAGNLFPRMLEKRLPLQCWEGRGYWCDIGDLATYLRCQRDMLEGKVDCLVHGERDKAGNVFADGLPGGGVTIRPPVYLGRDVRLGDGALLEAGTVVDDGCHVGGGARLSGSVLLPRCSVGRRARLTGALVCAGAGVKAGAMLFEGSAVGAGAVIGENASVHAGVKVWNQKVIPSSVTLTGHVKTGGGVPFGTAFDDGGVRGEIGVELTPEFAARFGGAVGSVFPRGRVGVGRGPHQSAGVLADALSAGVRAAGAGVLDFGESFSAQFEFCVNYCALPVGVYINGDQSACLRVVGAGGLPSTRELERKLEGVLARGELSRSSWDDMGDKTAMSGMGGLYRSELLRFAPHGLYGMRARVKCRNAAVGNTLRETLAMLGCDEGGELILELSADGDKLRLHDPESGYIPPHKALALCAAHRLGRGEDVAVPFDAPRVLDVLAARAGRQVLRYFICPADDSDQDARRLAAVQLWSRDALMQAVTLLSLLREGGGLGRLLARLPAFEVHARTVEIPGNPAGLIRMLDAGGAHPEPARVTEGVLLRREGGVVLVRPLKRGTAVRILSEAASSETAAELTADVERFLSENSLTNEPD